MEVNTEENLSDRITAEDLVKQLGERVSDRELARYLGYDVRTVRKYAHRWDGVEDFSGVWSFSRDRIKEIYSDRSGPAICSMSTSRSFASQGKPPSATGQAPTPESVRVSVGSRRTGGERKTKEKVRDKHGVWEAIKQKKEKTNRAIRPAENRGRPGISPGALTD